MQRVLCKNIIIKNCNIKAPHNTNDLTKCGIYIDSCENVIIQNNIIGDNTAGTQAKTYGIRVTSFDTSTRTKGIIRIGKNTIYGSGSSGIYISDLKDAFVNIIQNNLYNSNNQYGRYIALTNCVNCSYTTRYVEGQYYYNTHNSIDISTDNGIYVNNLIKYINSSDDNIQYRYVSIDATPSTLTDLIANAQTNTTINLTDGDYGFIMLKGKSSFPDNLTIYGTSRSNVKIAGVCITSNQPAHEVVKEDEYNNKDSDINNATMHKNLKFKNVTFTKPFSVRNCDITGLKIENCTFNDGATIELNPNGFSNFYGDDRSGTATFAPHYATRRAHDTVIKDCHFINGYALNETNGNELKHAIFARCVDGITIHNNIIDAANYNGIQINGNAWSATKPWYDAANRGRITITSNVINNTGSRSVRLNLFENAVITFIYNKMYNANLLPAEKTDNGEEAVKITKYDSNSRFVTTNYENEPNVKKTVQTNKYNDVTVTTGNTDKEYQIVSQQTSDFVKKNNWVTLTRGNCKECWGTITETIGHGMERIEFKLPFGVNDFVNWQITPKTGMFISYFDIMDIRADNDGNVELEINSSVANDYSSAELSLDIYCMTCDV